MEVTKFMFTVNEENIVNVKEYLVENNIHVGHSIELDAGASMLFLVKCTKYQFDLLREECLITVFNSNMPIKQII